MKENDLVFAVLLYDRNLSDASISYVDVRAQTYDWN